MTIIPVRDAGTLPISRRVNAPNHSTLASLPPLSVYVHVPWCVRKCPYCDFNSHAAAGEIPECAYLDALRADLEQALPSVWGRQVISVFIGGGTPSLLSDVAIEALLSMLRACLNLLPDAEITLEANPGTVEAQRFAAYAASGVNRLSLGIQSFTDAHLKQLGRIHDAAQARTAIAIAQRVVPHVNLDLMFALPGQDMASCLADLEQALAFGTDHLSFYHLTLEPQTVFAKYPPVLPDEDTSATMQDAIENTLRRAGWEHYEVSAYARPGGRCRHNLNYWQFGDYLGIGPGAHSKLSFFNGIERSVRLRQPASWMTRAVQYDASHIAEHKRLHADELPFEFMLNVLRLKEGVPSSLFAERTGLSLAAISRKLEAACKRRLLDPHPARIQATSLGWRFLNDLQQIFLSD